MKFLKSRRFYVSLMISVIISLFLVLPMILGLMGYDIFNRRPATMPDIPVWSALRAIGRQWLFYFLMIIILLVVNTADPKIIIGRSKVIYSIVIAVVFFFIFTIVPPGPYSPGPPARIPGNTEMAPPDQRGDMDPGRVKPEERPPFVRMAPDMRMMSEFIFIIITTVLIGQVMKLVEQKQQIQIENEQLKGENLQSRYDVLKNQIDPHFFFNSLNSLSALVREGKNENAIKYIGELSNTYRYVMQSPGKELVTVEEELDSVSAYCYLLQVRYENKLYVDIHIDEESKRLLLPVLALQPLIENAVKHNVISSAEPLTINIAGDASFISVSNPVRPKQDDSEMSGTGLRNLATRYKLLTGKEIEIDNKEGIFTVTLPLIKPEGA